MAAVAHFRLAVHQRLWLPVGAGVADVEAAQRLAVQVVVGRQHAAFLPHDSVVFRRGPVGWRDDGAVAVAGDVVGPHELAAGDAEVGGHGRWRHKVLRVVEGAQAGAAVHAAVGHRAVPVGEVQAGLRLVVGLFVEDAVWRVEREETETMKLQGSAELSKS